MKSTIPVDASFLHHSTHGSCCSGTW